MNNKRNGIQQAQLTVLHSIPVMGSEIAKNARTTIKRLSKSANKKNLDYSANLQNTIKGTVASGVTQVIDEEIPDTTMIQWLPSHADEIDPQHARNYGKQMTKEQALQLGLGTRYGCKCGMKILTDVDQTKRLTKLLEN